MSLLNDMLRDLSQDIARRPPGVPASDAHADSTASQQDLFSQSSVAKAAPRNILPSVIVFVLVLLAILGWRYGYQHQQIAQQQTISLATSSASSISAASIHSDASTDSVPSTDSAVAAPNLEAAESKKNPENNATEVIEAEQLTERLASLESAITHLTAVVANSQSLPSPTTDPAEKFVAIDDEHSSTTVPEQSVSIREPFVADQQAAAELEAQVSEQAATETADPALFIAPNRAWQDEQTAAQARAEFNAGQLEQGIARLQDFIANNPGAARSTELLLDIYCEQENNQAAAQLLARADYLAPEINTYYSAKIALLNNKPDEALALLEGSLAQAEQHENYRALLAGLYQRSGMNEQAASHYRRLLTSFGEKPAYWLGFALAQDALNQTQLALHAYQRVNQYSDLQPPVREYVEQRLVALSQ
ncbi:tetratricopeptide repeat protein [Cellvibrio fontiphilus]|uniref:Tetratricopeptide repeat protein n=1 Tax=Cellvibrio fontiphilus TaxID=1815559 RepID=A0ABV7FER6_9GAMM